MRFTHLREGLGNLAFKLSLVSLAHALFRDGFHGGILTALFLAMGLFIALWEGADNG